MNIQSSGKKLFVLDTNVLMHDPTAIFRFQEHNIFIPMVVLEELDHAKKGLSDVSRNVRQVSRFLDELIRDANQQTINDGLPLSRIEHGLAVDADYDGRLYFQTKQLSHLLPDNLPGQIADNSILSIVLALGKEYPDVNVILVSKDINMRIKAAALQLNAEDYHNDQTIEDIDLLYNGTMALEADFWEENGGKMESWQENNHTYYKVSGPAVADWFPNQFVYMDDESGFEAIVKTCDGQSAVLQLARDFRTKHNSVWGVCAKNREQNFALNALLDPNIDFVTLLGTAGTGKTLLALAAGLSLTMEHKLYQEIIMTRETVPVGQDIGFLPGSEEEKMAPWMGALMDNLELLGSRSGNTEWEQGASQNVLMNRVKIRSLNFMRGRTFLNRFLIIDEAQNLTPKQMKTLITRAGPGTKIICIGNLGQIDTPYLTATSSGLTYVVDRFKAWANSAHITLRRGERSRLADFASDNL
ncbi:PhoH family protein [Methylomonas sp. MED-D]|uniref:Phosphate starvation-inducible protein PhoH n=1 Tax=Methylomonas koyamae TaxID=702114 RepID=A0A177P2W5_9GAMM|nr:MULTISPECIES: PhoH family protein [Methylomonas]NJA04965.1 PhoH family protein [Methylococcaceae bacterium WWC4]MDT4331033.1 PhoH family protein [Methylomonas sp. MV1]OAI23700.1 phosphate starvation-inducible protein PhoH [Methylomonas koyamae]OHX34085.1 phosphate starvation-inducible protein PhoH [Methylomonas sp. LWB]WGS84813.1 PhoH family protein [Methylomonas sp. UP202]